MPDKQCKNGHMIDESWDLCPFCPPEKKEPPPSFSVVLPRQDPAGTSAAIRPPEPSSPEVHPPLPKAPPAPKIPPSQEAPSSPSPGRISRTSVMAKPILAAASKRFVVGWLVGLNRTARGESFPIRIGRNVLGRDRASDLYVQDDLVSGHHADLVFRPEERRYILMDSNSTNGTFVNGEEISQRHDLSANDVISVGNHRFLFVPLCHEGFYWEDEGLLK